MKKTMLMTCLGALVLGGYFFRPVMAQPKLPPQTFQYAVIKWGGRENTHVIRPNGEFEMLGPLFADLAKRREKGERVDDRALCMTLAINALAKEGYEVAAMTADQVVMKRASVVSHK